MRAHRPAASSRRPSACVRLRASARPPCPIRVRDPPDRAPPGRRVLAPDATGRAVAGPGARCVTPGAPVRTPSDGRGRWLRRPLPRVASRRRAAVRLRPTDAPRAAGRQAAAAGRRPWIHAAPLRRVACVRAPGRRSRSPCPGRAAAVRRWPAACRRPLRAWPVVRTPATRPMMARLPRAVPPGPPAPATAGRAATARAGRRRRGARAARARAARAAGAVLPDRA